MFRKWKKKKKELFLLFRSQMVLNIYIFTSSAFVVLFSSWKKVWRGKSVVDNVHLLLLSANKKMCLRTHHHSYWWLMYNGPEISSAFHARLYLWMNNPVDLNSVASEGFCESREKFQHLFSTSLPAMTLQHREPIEFSSTHFPLIFLLLAPSEKEEISLFRCPFCHSTTAHWNFLCSFF